MNGNTSFSLVFQACDRGSKGFLTIEDIKVASEFLVEEDQRTILDILHLGELDVIDYHTFKIKVGKYMEGKLHGPGPAPSPGPEPRRGPSPGNSPVSNLDSGFHGSKRTDDSCMSPFSPILNSSHYIQKSTSPILNSSQFLHKPHKRNVTSCRSFSRPPSSVEISETTFHGSGEESSASGRSKRSGDRGWRKRKTRRDSLESYSCRSSNSSICSLPEKINSKMCELTDKLDEVQESTVQTKHEISSLLHYFINKSNESQDEFVYQTEKRRKMNEMANLETELLRIKMEGQVLEAEKLRTSNIELSAKIVQLEKDKNELQEQLIERREAVAAMEGKLNKTRLENRELIHKLETTRASARNLEEHIEFLEERRQLHLHELKQTKDILESEKKSIRDERLQIIKEKDGLREQLQEVVREKEEQEVERRNIEREAEKIRVERENFLLAKCDFESRRSDEFVMVEASGELDSILTENRLLRDGLDQLAREKTELEKELRTSRTELDNLKAETMVRNSSHKAKQDYRERENLKDIIKEKERVISSLMDVVENFKKGQNSTKFIKEHERALREVTVKISDSANRIEKILSDGKPGASYDGSLRNTGSRLRTGFRT